MNFTDEPLKTILPILETKLKQGDTVSFTVLTLDCLPS